MLMYTRQLGIYDYPTPVLGENSDLTTTLHSPHVAELLELQATSGGKNVIIVSKPSIPGKKDDFSDGFARSVHLAAEYVKANPHVLEASKVSVGPLPPRRPVQTSFFAAQRARARFHGPPPKERRVPASMRRR